MSYYLIAQGGGAAILWSLFAACYVWNEKAQTLASHGFSLFTFFTALTFTALGALNIITLAGMQ